MKKTHCEKCGNPWVNPVKIHRGKGKPAGEGCRFCYNARQKAKLRQQVPTGVIPIERKRYRPDPNDPLIIMQRIEGMRRGIVFQDEKRTLRQLRNALRKHQPKAAAS